MGRLRNSNASGYLPNAYVQQYVEVSGLDASSVEAQKITLSKASLRTAMLTVLRHLRPPPFSPPRVLTLQELQQIIQDRHEVAIALTALEGQRAIVRFGFGPSACYSLPRHLLNMTAGTASADLHVAHTVAMEDHIMGINEPGKSTGCLGDASEGHNDSGARAEEDSIVLIRRHVACKIPGNGILMCAAQSTRMARAARKRSTPS
ncbi:g2172 [Coccomyxa elongata]